MRMIPKAKLRFAMCKRVCDRNPETLEFGVPKCKNKKVSGCTVSCHIHLPRLVLAYLCNHRKSSHLPS